jgi:NADH-quinone oxidoreductase subunit C
MDSLGLFERLQAILPEARLEHAPGVDSQTTVYAAAEGLHATLETLRDREDLCFACLAELTAVDIWPREPRFELIYILISLKHRVRLRLKVRLYGSDARVPTASDVWPAANWLEREVWDLFGITFDGHPNLRRLLMPDDWEGFPLRKDYPVQIDMKPGISQPLQVTAAEFQANVMQDRRARG